MNIILIRARLYKFIMRNTNKNLQVKRNNKMQQVYKLKHSVIKLFSSMIYCFWFFQQS